VGGSAYRRLVDLLVWASDTLPRTWSGAPAHLAVCVVALDAAGALVADHAAGGGGACMLCVNDPSAGAWADGWPCSTIRTVGLRLLPALEQLARTATSTARLRPSPPC
jgi:hypothetical protein